MFNLLSPKDFKSLNEREAPEILADEHKHKGDWVEIKPEDHEDLKDDFFNLIKTAYADIGGHAKIKNPDDVFADPDWNYFKAIDLDDDDKFDLIRISNKNQFGDKSVAVGHDGSKEAKKTYLEDAELSLKRKGNYAEVSGKLADILMNKYNVPAIEDEKEVREVLKGKEITWLGANPDDPENKGKGWYSRKIGGELHNKILVGHPLVKESSDESTGDIIFFHGLESSSVGDKSNWLKETYGEKAYCPAMDYNDPEIFTKILASLKDKKIDLIIGSSLGGYFGYWISKHLNVPTVLFNPALQYKVRKFKVDEDGEYSPFHNVILGEKDDIVKSDDIIKWFETNENPGNYHIDLKDMGHRVPLDIFKSAVLTNV